MPNFTQTPLSAANPVHVAYHQRVRRWQTLLVNNPIKFFPYFNHTDDCICLDCCTPYAQCIKKYKQLNVYRCSDVHYNCLCHACCSQLLIPREASNTRSPSCAPSRDNINRIHQSGCPGCAECLREYYGRKSENPDLFFVFHPTMVQEYQRDNLQQTSSPAPLQAQIVQPHPHPAVPVPPLPPRLQPPLPVKYSIPLVVKVNAPRW